MSTAKYSSHHVISLQIPNSSHLSSVSVTSHHLWLKNWHFSLAFSTFLLNTWTVNCQYASQFASCPSVEIVSIDGGLRGSGPLTGTYLEWQLCFGVSQCGTVIRLGEAQAGVVNVSYHFVDTVIQIVLQYHEWTECFGSSKCGSLYITWSDHWVKQPENPFTCKTWIPLSLLYLSAT